MLNKGINKIKCLKLNWINLEFSQIKCAIFEIKRFYLWINIYEKMKKKQKKNWWNLILIWNFNNHVLFVNSAH